MFRIYILIGIVVLIGSIVTGGYVYVSNLQENLEFYKIEYTKVNEAYDMQEQVLTNMQNQIKINKILRAELQSSLTEARKKAVSTKKLFAKHDIEKLMIAKKDTMTRLMRKATIQVFKELEIETQ